MIWNFTCNKETCSNKGEVIRLVNAINPVLCSACYTLSDAVVTEELAPPAPIEE
jgi:hypothetical protein